MSDSVQKRYYLAINFDLIQRKLQCTSELRYDLRYAHVNPSCRPQSF